MASSVIVSFMLPGEITKEKLHIRIIKPNQISISLCAHDILSNEHSSFEKVLCRVGELNIFNASNVTELVNEGDLECLF